MANLSTIAQELGELKKNCYKLVNFYCVKIPRERFEPLMKQFQEKEKFLQVEHRIFFFDYQPLDYPISEINVQYYAEQAAINLIKNIEYFIQKIYEGYGC